MARSTGWAFIPGTRQELAAFRAAYMTAYDHEHRPRSGFDSVQWHDALHRTVARIDDVCTETTSPAAVVTSPPPSPTGSPRPDPPEAPHEPPGPYGSVSAEPARRHTFRRSAPMGHLWRWEPRAVDRSRTEVTHTYDWTGLDDERRFARARRITTAWLQASLDRLMALAEGVALS